MKNKEIDKKIAELKKEMEQLEYEKSKTGISPSQTKELIEKYYGHCFSVEGYESGSCKFMLDTIKVDRKKETITIGGDFIIYLTPDICFLNLPNNIYGYGGTMLAKCDFDIETLPYVPDLDWDGSIHDQLDEILSDLEIPADEYADSLEEADEYADNFGWVTPLQKVYEDKEKGWDYDYQKIFGNL